MNITLSYLLFLVLTVFFGCDDKKPLESQPKKLVPIPEDPAWKLARKFSDQTSAERIAIVSHYTTDPQNIEFIKLATSNHTEYAKKHKYDYYFRNGTIKGTERFFDPNGENRTFQLGLFWQKVQAIEEVLQLKKDNKYVYDYVFWIDADAIFTAMDRPIEKYIKDASKDTYFYVAQDLWSQNNHFRHTCINAGVFMVKNSQKGRNLITNVGRAFKLHKTFKLPEQAALQDLVYGYLKPEDIDKIAANKNDLEKFIEQTGKRDCDIPPPDDVKLYGMSEFNGAYAFEFEQTKWTAASFTAHFLSFDGFMTEKYMRPLLDCLRKNYYEHRERCSPQRLNIH